jgi:ubiquinone/menaquinone biosynthesis C-methylase UbiE
MSDAEALAKAKTKAKEAYDATADHFDDPPLAFWDRYGRRTVERIALAPGAKVLDVCSGSGASAIPAAEAVGPTGSVLAIDLSDRLLDLARKKAAAKKLYNLEIKVGDMTATGLADASFDAVLIVFGIFFVPDMVAQTRELLRLLRPGGTLAITTWGPRLFEPLDAKYRASIERHQPAVANRFNPWDRLPTPESVARLMNDAGAREVEAIAEAGTQALSAPEDWWTIVLGTGYRWTIDRLGPEARARVEADMLEAARGVAAVETNVIYGRASP